jgi:hypothetical protein
VPKPQPKGGSRKGRPNKITATLKEMILGALDDAGGRGYLCSMAHAEPVAFLSLIGKVLPTTLAGDPNDPLVIEVVQIAYSPLRALPAPGDRNAGGGISSPSGIT